MINFQHLYTIIFLLFSLHLSGQFEKKSIITNDEILPMNFSGFISLQYSNGSPKTWKTMKNGMADGLWLEWYPNGTLRFRSYWKNDMGNGKWEYFYPNGQLRSESFYINDLAQGFYRDYHENGQLSVDAVYLNGKKHGPEVSYDSNGIVLSKKFYENGKRIINEPVIFEAGKFSNEESNEWGICFTRDNSQAYFTRRDLSTGEKRIYTSRIENGKWSIPKIAVFSTHEDESPFISHDNQTLLFASYRPMPNGATMQDMDMNLWQIDLTDPDATPLSLGERVNKNMTGENNWPQNYEAGPTQDKHGNLYYWSKSTEKNSTNIFFSELKNQSYQKPQELVEPSDHHFYDSSPILSPDGNYLFFTSDNRPDGYGGSDIYYSKKENGNWTVAKNLGPTVNSPLHDAMPSFSPDGKHFYFSSTRSGKLNSDGEKDWDIYFMESKYLSVE